MIHQTAEVFLSGDNATAIWLELSRRKETEQLSPSEEKLYEALMKKFHYDSTFLFVTSNDQQQ